MKKIGIIGGGISGLYFANLLNNQKNYEYKIFEKKEKYDFSKGYGIQLATNSIKILNKIDFKKIDNNKIYHPNRVDFYNIKNKWC